MSILLKPQKVDIKTDTKYFICINKKSGLTSGLAVGDRVSVEYNGKMTYAMVYVIDDPDFTETVGISPDLHTFFSDLLTDTGKKKEEVFLSIEKFVPTSVEYLKAKIERKNLTEEQIHTIVSEISNNALSESQIAFFLSGIYNPGYTSEELTSLVKLLVKTNSSGVISENTFSIDSLGNYSSSAVALAVLAIVSSYGVDIVYLLSEESLIYRMMKIFIRLEYSLEEVRRITEKVHGCLVSKVGGNLLRINNLLEKVEKSISVESVDRNIINIFAEKLSLGINGFVLDLPVGADMRIRDERELNYFKAQFRVMAESLGVKASVLERYPSSLDGNAIGLLLELREVLYVLERDERKSISFEQNAVGLAGKLLEISGQCLAGEGNIKAVEAIKTGKALGSFNDVISTQKGVSLVSDKLYTSNINFSLKSVVNGVIRGMQIKNIIELACIAGYPDDPYAGIYFNKKNGEVVKLDDLMFTVFSSDDKKIENCKKYVLENDLYLIT